MFVHDVLESSPTLRQMNSSYNSSSLLQLDQYRRKTKNGRACTEVLCAPRDNLFH